MGQSLLPIFADLILWCLVHILDLFGNSKKTDRLFCPKMPFSAN